MRHTAVMFGKDFNLFVIDPNCMREPDIITDPVHFLHITNGTMTEHLHAELFFVFGFGEMRMEMHAILSRQFRGLFHQIRSDAER